MTVAAAVTVEPAVVPGPFGDRFRLVVTPAHGAPRGTVIALPPLFEEMNKARRMTSRFARTLAADGWKVVICDLHGCGDSSGELRDAQWSMWIDELELELRAAEGPVWLWATRGGALFVPELLTRAPGRRIDVLLWQPVPTGATHLSQFLRQHAAARMLDASRAQADEASPSRRLKAGETVEVGGYEINPSLAAGLDQARLRLTPSVGDVVWFELSAMTAADTCAAPAPSPAVEAAVQRLRGDGTAIDLQCLAGPHFWLTQEIEECEALIERSVSRMNRPSATAPVLAEVQP